ncbi:adenylate/guanylate cyclase domain-containing protein [Aerophototrophica crusticola]|uniref:Adenylate/guanylate cyclase domain-containing protein n=2 Tax=Aerophototrophica crusticola TaxID=1709002 RepID=A0A858RB72_9PROT|nr:adenylate/guanylate cyclase domain-containing protein [Rhodospirillaceae bacterium B3]
MRDSAMGQQDDGQGTGSGGPLGPAAPVVAWLLAEGYHLSTAPTLLEGFLAHLRALGLGIDRCSLNVRLLHPQIRGITYTWRSDRDGVEQVNREHGVEHTPGYKTSPIAAIMEDGSEGIRVPMGRVPPPYGFPIVDELAAEGFTDYAAMPLLFSNGRRNVFSVATRRPEGFTTDELALLYASLPALTVLLETRMLRLLASNLLNTYVGPGAGQRILDGDIRRGSGLTIGAVLWFCDLRGFTVLADTLPIGQLIALLNNYFEIMGGAVQRRGGEILKFVGDAILAIFPLDPAGGDADRAAKCALAMGAAEEAMAGMEAVNAERAAWGIPQLGAGIAMHVGDVLYGNIGTTDRLDFTVIGPAVNLVTRLEGLTRTLDRPLLTSAEFAAAWPGDRLKSLGYHPVKGLKEPVEVFGLG